MKFKLEHEFPCSAEKFWNFTFSEDYMNGIRRVMKLKVYEKIETVRKGDVETVRMRMVPKAQFPGVVKKILGAKDFETEDTYTLHHDTMRVEWSNKNNLVPPERGGSGGRMQLTKIGPNKCKRTIEGQIEVYIPIIGKQIEKFVVGQVLARFEEQAEFIRSWAQSQK